MTFSMSSDKAILWANVHRIVATLVVAFCMSFACVVDANAHDDVVVVEDVTEDLDARATGEEKKLDEFGILGSPQRFSGAYRKTLYVRRGGKPVEGEPGCSHRHVNCESVCFFVPSIPTRYRAVLDDRWSAVHADPPSSYFNTNFGGAWARLEETLWEAQGGGRYKVCFLAKNWKHDWDRAFNIEVRF